MYHIQLTLCPIYKYRAKTGKQCNKMRQYTYLSFVVVVEVVVIFRLIGIQRLAYPLTLSFIPD